MPKKEEKETKKVKGTKEAKETKETKEKKVVKETKIGAKEEPAEKAKEKKPTKTKAVKKPAKSKAVKKSAKPKREKTIIFYGTGRRKNAIARVRLIPGKGKFDIGGKELDKYFGRETLCILVRKPFEITNTLGKFDVLANVYGGGVSGQAGAVQHGISRALLEADQSFRGLLKKAGLVTRDSRMKERRKYGLKKARKAPQFSKR